MCVRACSACRVGCAGAGVRGWGSGDGGRGPRGWKSGRAGGMGGTVWREGTRKEGGRLGAVRGKGWGGVGGRGLVSVLVGGGAVA